MNKQKPATIDEYISAFPEETQALLTKMRTTISKAAPKATECISYGMPTYKYNGNLVHFAAMKKHIGFYPTPSAITAFADELTDYVTSKGAIQFPLDKGIPISLVTKIVKFRVKENQSKE